MIQWQRLDRDSSISVIENVKSASDPGMMSLASCQVERAWLPFYEGVYAYKVTNFASLPSFTFEYLGDGQFFQYLDGTNDPIYSVNDKATLHLNEVHVLDYLEFYFSHVSDPEDGEITMIRSPHDMPLLDSLAPSAFEAVMRSFEPPRTERNQDGSFTVHADLYIDGVVVHATLRVGAKGRVKMLERKMRMSSMQKSTETGNFMV